MIITISGNAGSGKSTVAKILVEKLNAERIYIGGLWRDFFREKGVTLQQMEGYARKHPEADREMDERVSAQARALEQQGKTVVVEGRAQSHFLPESIKIFIKVDPVEGARRIWYDLQQKEIQQQRNEGVDSSLEETQRRTMQREEEDALRYKKIYGFDYRDARHYDLVVDSTRISAEEVAKKVMKFISGIS